MKPGKRTIAATVLICAAFLLFRLPTVNKQEEQPTTAGEDYHVAYHDGITLADVARTRHRFFEDPLGVTIQRRDSSLAGRAKEICATAAFGLWKQTGEQSQVLFDVGLRSSPARLEIVCPDPANDQTKLYPDDSILITTRTGTTILGFHSP